MIKFYEKPYDIVNNDLKPGKTIQEPKEAPKNQVKAKS